MQFKGVELCCPRCRGDLQELESGQFQCSDCDASYPVVEGIPDFRVFDDPYISAEEDREKGVRIAAVTADHTFDSLIDFYYSNTSVVPPEHARQYKAGLLGAEAKARATLEMWDTPSVSRLLEIGCGTGPMMVAARERVDQLVGVDIAFRWLQVGKKRLEEAGVDAPLICACAEALPFPAGSFDAVAMDSTLELVHDQAQTLDQTARVTTSGGDLFVAMANRFNLGPDPHTGLLAGSILPDALTAWYMRRKKAIPPVRQLLSARSAARLLEDHGFRRVEVTLPYFPPEQMQFVSAPVRMAVSAYHHARRLPLMRDVLRVVGPRLLLHAQRSPV